MTTMQDYTIYCTPEQTKKALELGAPIEKANTLDDLKNQRYLFCDYGKIGAIVPTAEQMCGLLRKEYSIQVFVSTLAGNTASVFVKNEFTMFNVNGSDEMPISFDSYEQAILAGIDAALDYLVDNDLIK